MIRRLTAVLAGVGVMLAGSLAQAQTRGGFGDQGEFIFSADRLFPVLGYSHGSLDEPGTQTAGVTKVTDSESQSSLGFFWGATPAFNGAGAAGLTVPNVYTVPRLGFDYSILPNITVGGDLVVFFTLGGNASQETYLNGGSTQTVSTPEPKTTVFGIAPRAGYILHLTDLLAVWLRGGFSYYTSTSKTSTTNNGNTTTNSFNFDQLSLDLEPQLVITPVPHFGFTVGVTGDIPLTGGISESTGGSAGSASVSSHASLLFVGMTGGLVGWF